MPSTRSRLAFARNLLIAALWLAAPAALAGPVEDLLSTELAAHMGAGLPAGSRIAVRLALPFSGPIDAIRDLTYDPRSNEVRALVVSNGRLHDLAGRADVEVDVPVPGRRILPGEILGEDDLTTVPLPYARISAQTIASKEALIGMAARRQLAPGRLIQAGSIGAPIIVERNKPVTIVYEDGALYLAAQGRALQDGGLGDEVRVANTSSNTVVSGTVSGHRTVTITP